MTLLMSYATTFHWPVRPPFDKYVTSIVVRKLGGLNQGETKIASIVISSPSYFLDK